MHFIKRGPYVDTLELVKSCFFASNPTIQCCLSVASAALQYKGAESDQGITLINFDSGMAIGVRENFRSTYIENMISGMEEYLYFSEQYQLLPVCRDTVFHSIRQTAAVVPEQPELGNSSRFVLMLRDQLAAYFNQDRPYEISRIEERSRKRTESEITTTTRYEIEAFIKVAHLFAAPHKNMPCIHYGMDTSAEGRLVSKCTLEAEESQIRKCKKNPFPHHLFALEEGVNNQEGDPNYDLYKQALSLTKRYANFGVSFEDARQLSVVVQ